MIVSGGGGARPCRGRGAQTARRRTKGLADPSGRAECRRGVHVGMLKGKTRIRKGEAGEEEERWRRLKKPWYSRGNCEGGRRRLTAEEFEPPRPSDLREQNRYRMVKPEAAKDPEGNRPMMNSKHSAAKIVSVRSPRRKPTHQRWNRKCRGRELRAFLLRVV